jgi:hypothetical protein
MSREASDPIKKTLHLQQITYRIAVLNAVGQSLSLKTPNDYRRCREMEGGRRSVTEKRGAIALKAGETKELEGRMEQNIDRPTCENQQR